MNSKTKQRLVDCASSARSVFDALEADGFKAWLVGGCVRDILNDTAPKDIDLATDATPEQAARAYEKAGLKVIETGLKHGTLTAVANSEQFEITTLRTESGHDGRHADVAWTTSLEDDLLRRDLTINAMAAARDGTIIDPFGGVDDLANKRVRFVGNADERIEEDHLRILRFFRFHARFAGDSPIDPEAHAAIGKGQGGLAKISVERVWSELSKIVVHQHGANMVDQMNDLGLFETINLPAGDINRLQKAIDAKVTNPAVAMGLMLDPGSPPPNFKWSNEERVAYEFANARHSYDLTQAKYDLVKGTSLETVSQVTRFSSFDMPEWEVPKFPVAGKDLIAQGMKPGPDMGAILKRLEQDWVNSDYQATHKQLMAKAAVPAAHAHVQMAHFQALGASR